MIKTTVSFFFSCCFCPVREMSLYFLPQRHSGCKNKCIFPKKGNALLESCHLTWFLHWKIYNTFTYVSVIAQNLCISHHFLYWRQPSPGPVRRINLPSGETSNNKSLTGFHVSSKTKIKQ